MVREKKTLTLYFVLKLKNKVETFFYCFFFGFAIECIQYFLPYRSFELLDQAANSFGAFAGLFIIIRKNKAAD